MPQEVLHRVEQLFHSFPYLRRHIPKLGMVDPMISGILGERKVGMDVVSVKAEAEPRGKPLQGSCVQARRECENARP